jgi:hypothetical protein
VGGRVQWCSLAVSGEGVVDVLGMFNREESRG